jgi:type I restriction enzyme R subunit
VTPEQKARQKIEQQLVQCGWLVQNYREMNISAGPGVPFTADQRKWLDAIKDHIASSLHIEQDTFDDLPFRQMGGLGRAYELFGDGLTGILEELNERSAA